MFKYSPLVQKKKKLLFASSRLEAQSELSQVASSRRRSVSHVQNQRILFLSAVLICQNKGTRWFIKLKQKLEEESTAFVGDVRSVQFYYFFSPIFYVFGENPGFSIFCFSGLAVWNSTRASFCLDWRGKEFEISINRTLENQEIWQAKREWIGINYLSRVFGIEFWIRNWRGVEKKDIMRKKTEEVKILNFWGDRSFLLRNNVLV